MKEVNKEILQQAIKKMPTYEPPQSVWEQLEVELDYDTLTVPTEKLPQYNPPDTLWENIAAELPSSQNKWVRRKWWVLGFLLVVVVSTIGYFYFKNHTTEKLEITTEEVEVIFASEDWENDDEAFDMILAYCKQAALVCDNPKFRTLKTDLEELNEASETLKNAIGNFSTESQLIEQLKEIELQRSDILKEMIAEI